MLARFHRTVVVAPRTEDVCSVATRMKNARVGAVVVVDGKRPVGIVTDRDLALRVVAAGRDPNETLVEEIMTPSPVTIDEDRTIEAALRAMRAAGVRRLPMLDARGELVGMLTSDDLVRLLAGELGDVAQTMEESVDAPELR